MSMFDVRPYVDSMQGCRDDAEVHVASPFFTMPLPKRISRVRARVLRLIENSHFYQLVHNSLASSHDRDSPHDPNNVCPRPRAALDLRDTLPAYRRSQFRARQLSHSATHHTPRTRRSHSYVRTCAVVPHELASARPRLKSPQRSAPCTLAQRARPRRAAARRPASG